MLGPYSVCLKSIKLLRNFQTFSISYTILFPPAMNEDYNVSTQYLLMSFFFHYSLSSMSKILYHCDFDLLFLFNVKCLFMCLLGICMSFLETHLFICFGYLLIGLYVFFKIFTAKVHYIFDIFSYQIYYLQICSIL